MINEKKLIEDIHKYFYKKIEELTGEVYDDSPVTKEERELYTMNKEICGIIKAQPTIEPYGTWIPCSERLPNKPEFGWDGYLVQDAYIVKPYDAYWNGKCWTDIDDNVLDNIVAWMPLPEPYGEE